MAKALFLFCLIITIVFLVGFLIGYVVGRLRQSEEQAITLGDIYNSTIDRIGRK